MQPKNSPAGGQWAEQQKIADEKQKRRPKETSAGQGSNEEQEGGAGKPQSSPMEPEKQGGIGGP